MYNLAKRKRLCAKWEKDTKKGFDVFEFDPVMGHYKCPICELGGSLQPMASWQKIDFKAATTRMKEHLNSRTHKEMVAKRDKELSKVEDAKQAKQELKEKVAGSWKYDKTDKIPWSKAYDMNIVWNQQSEVWNTHQMDVENVLMDKYCKFGSLLTPFILF